MARHRKFPQIKLEGINALPQYLHQIIKSFLLLIDKGAILQGFGIKNVVKIQSNSLIQMIPQDLKNIIDTLNNGEIPLFVFNQ